VQAIDTARARPGVSPEAHDTAARLGALVRHLFLHDRGNQLRVLEESGLSLTQCKVLLELGGLGSEPEPRQVGELAELFGASLPSTSRAIDGLVRKRLITRVEDREDRRVRRVAITDKGKQLVNTLTLVRMAGLETFAAGLTAAERRRLDGAIDALMGRADIAESYEHLREVLPR
jgi:DNA-binding MarR family transcriptional regulator